MSDVSLHLLEGQNFHCRSCGRCCRASWNIVVEPEGEEAIRGSRSYEELRQQGQEPLVTVDGRLVLGRKTCGACQFLGDDGKCSIHSELGGEKKPIVCQIYPYLLTQTPDGIFSSMSFACPTVLENAGPPLESSRSELEHMLETRGDDVPRIAVAGEKIELLTGKFISWAFYKELERYILKSFSAERPVETLLSIAVRLVLSERDGGGLDGASGLEEIFSSEALGGDPLAGFDKELLSMVCCNLIAILEDVADPVERIKVGSLLWNGAPYSSSKLGVSLPPFSIRQPGHQETVVLIDRYMRGAIWGKRLLSGTVVSRLLAYSCAMALVLHYSLAIMDEASGCYSIKAMDSAFRLLESELISHTRSFDGFFVEFEHSLRKVRDILN